MRYDFLIETYETERIKVITAWSMFTDNDLPVRPNVSDPRGRSLHEHMVHQCVSEDFWFRTMLDIDVGAPPLPKEEVRLEFMRRYEEDSDKRLAVKAVCVSIRQIPGAERVETACCGFAFE